MLNKDAARVKVYLIADMSHVVINSKMYLVRLWK